MVGSSNGRGTTVGYRVSKLRIKNCGKIEAAEYSIGAAGVVFAGRNMAGKTTHMRAVEVLLERVGLADAVRHIRVDAGKAELFLELEGEGQQVAIARSITEKGAQDPRIRIGEAALSPREPRTWLEALIGRPALDPLAFWRADAKRQRQLLLEALPITVTAEELRAWAEVPDAFSVAGHGLEVLARLRDVHYQARAGANARAKAAEQEAARLEAEAERARASVPAKAPTPEAAAAALEDRRARHARLVAEFAAAAAARQRTEGARARVAALRGEAARDRELAAKTRPADAALTKAREETNERLYAAKETAGKLVAARALVAKLEAELGPQQVAVQAAEAAEKRLVDAARGADALEESARRADDQAAALEATIGAVGDGPAPEQVEEVRVQVEEAQAGVRAAEAWSAAAAATARASAAAAALASAKRDAARLDGYVDRLTHAAPAALLAKTLGAGGGEQDFLAGISLEGEHILVENGEGARVRLEVLSGAERLRFAVDLAKRLAVKANARLRVFVVHELEAVDEESRHAFLSYVVEGGWQILASCVARSDRNVLGHPLPSAQIADFRAEDVDALLVEEAPTMSA